MKHCTDIHDVSHIDATSSLEAFTRGLLGAGRIAAVQLDRRKRPRCTEEVGEATGL